MADEVRATAARSSSSSTVRIEDAGAVLAAGATQPPGAVALLIYLNERAFTDAGGVVTATVQRAMDARMPIALVNEQDEERGACVFARYFELAPDVLQRQSAVAAPRNEGEQAAAARGEARVVREHRRLAREDRPQLRGRAVAQERRHRGRRVHAETAVPESADIATTTISGEQALVVVMTKTVPMKN